MSVFVDNFLNSLDTLKSRCVLSVRTGMVIKLSAGGLSRNLKLILHLFTSAFKIALHLQGRHIIIIGNIEQNIVSDINKSYKVLHEGENKSVFINLVAFLTENVEDLIRCNIVALNLCDHIGMLGKVADRFVRDLSRTLNRYDFLLLNDELSRNTDNIVKGNDTRFDLLNPSEVDLLFKISVEQGIAVRAALDSGIHLVIELVIRSCRGEMILVFKI